jgi:hypothetical protein
MIEELSKVAPQIGLIAGFCGVIGWTIRGILQKTNTPAVNSSKPANNSTSSDKGPAERIKNLEAALEKSKASHKSLKAELENLQSASIAKGTHESALADLEQTRKSLDAEAKRSAALEIDFKKSQDTLKSLNARVNDADKAQKERSFAHENELSKAREQLALLQNRPDDSAVLQAEIDRLRESVAVSTRYAGEVRKREAAAIQALEKAEARLVGMGEAARPEATNRGIGPVAAPAGESDRVLAAKAEVLRLLEQNKQKEVAALEEAPEVI